MNEVIKSHKQHSFIGIRWTLPLTATVNTARNKSGMNCRIYTDFIVYPLKGTFRHVDNPRLYKCPIYNSTHPLFLNQALSELRQKELNFNKPTVYECTHSDLDISSFIILGKVTTKTGFSGPKQLY